MTMTDAVKTKLSQIMTMMVVANAKVKPSRWPHRVFQKIGEHVRSGGLERRSCAGANRLLPRPRGPPLGPPPLPRRPFKPHGAPGQVAAENSDPAAAAEDQGSEEGVEHQRHLCVGGGRSRLGTNTALQQQSCRYCSPPPHHLDGHCVTTLPANSLKPLSHSLSLFSLSLSLSQQSLCV